MNTLLRLERGIRRLSEWLGKIAATLLIVMVLIMAWNVIARKLFDASSIGLEELSWHFYAAVFLLGIPFALTSDSHVRVDLIFEKLSPKKQALIDMAGSLIFLLPFCMIVIWSGWHFTLAAYQLGDQPGTVGEFFSYLTRSGIGERSQDPGGLLNRWIIKGVIPLSFFFLLLAGIGAFIQRLNIYLAQQANEGAVE